MIQPRKMIDLLPSGRYTDLTSEGPGEEETEFDNHGDLPQNPEQAADSKRTKRQSWTDREVVEQAVEQRHVLAVTQYDNQHLAQKRA